MKAVILTASQSTRLAPFTTTRPKPMLPIAGKHLIEPMLGYLKESGIREVIIVVNQKQSNLTEHIHIGDGFGLKVQYVLQEKPVGIGDALKRCQPYIGDEHFVLAYGDVLSSGNIFLQAMTTYYETGKPLAVVTLPKESNEFGNVYLDHNMMIQKLVEKPKDGQYANYVFAGVFVLPGSTFSVLNQCDMSMEGVFQHWVQEKGLQATLWEGDWIDMIYPWHILEANKMMMKNWSSASIHHTAKLKGNVYLEGSVIIDENVIVESGSVLHGPCYIGKNSYIGNNTLIRENSTIGENSVIGYGTELKNCVLFGNTTVGRLSFIGDSVVGEGVMLGSGTTTVNHSPLFEEVQCSINEVQTKTGLSKLGSFIGDNVVIGARNSLGPGLVVPSGKIIEDCISLKN